jgi:hypothetical protein
MSRRTPPPAGAWLALALAALVAGCEDERASFAPAVPLPDETPAPTETPAPEAVPPAQALPDFSDTSWSEVRSRAGTYDVRWRSSSGQVPRNQDFALEVWVLKDGVVARDLHLDVNAWMPDHGHGMLRRPRAVAQPNGSFRVEGVLLHMRGHWKLRFEMLSGTVAETAEVALDL